MSDFTITIHISQNDVAILKTGKYALYAFKAIASNGKGSFPIWYKLDTLNLSTQTMVSWKNKFTAYNSVSNIENGEEIYIGNSIKAELGYLIDIDIYGNLSSSYQELGDLIGFRNNSTIEYTVGFTQTAQHSHDKENIVCAFPLFGGGAARVFSPVNKVALIFSSVNFQMGTIIERAMSAGILIDLNGADNNNRTVNFSVDYGWTLNHYSWSKNFDFYTKLSNLLTETLTLTSIKDISLLGKVY